MKLFGKNFIQIIYLSTIINSVKCSPLEPTILSETVPTTTIPSTIDSTVQETVISSTYPIITNNESYNSFDSITISNFDTTIDRQTNLDTTRDSQTNLDTTMNKETNLDSTMDNKTNIEELKTTEIIEPIDPLPTSIEENINNNYDNGDKCWDIEPTKGIIEDCILGVQLQNETCCYMTVKYKYNTLHACIPVLKDKNEIDRRIKILNGIYTGNKSIKINCFVCYLFTPKKPQRNNHQERKLAG